MSSDQALASVRPSATNVLLRDHMVQLAAWVIAVETAIYSVPLLDPAALAALGVSRFEIPFVATAAAAAFYRLNRIDDRDERRFWQTLGAGSLMWLVTVILVTVFPRTGSNPARDAVVAAGYLCFYVPFLLAAERTPHLARIAGHESTARWLSWSGLMLVSLCWFAYFVVVPIAIDPARSDAPLAAGPLFIILDVMIVARFVSLAVECRSPRWTVLYGSIATAMGAGLATNVLDTLVARRLVDLPGGSWTDVIWGVPPLCLLVAFRLRHLEWPSAGSAATQGESTHGRTPATVAFLLMALAACFPLVHFALNEMGMLAPAAETARNVVALGAMILAGGMSIVTYRILERQRAEAARAPAALEERLREAKKMEALSRFSSVVAHEFLNLINAIGGYIDLTLDALGADDVHAGHLRRAHDVVRRTAGFTKRLLILSRGQPFPPTAVVFNQTLQDLMPEIRALVKPPATVDAMLGSDDGCVAISAGYLREVLVPLAANASEAMERGGTLTIETEWVELDPQQAISRAVRPGRYGKVVVRDTGVGMPKDVLAHLYEPFFTTKPKPRVRGLGLATAYVVINQHGGSVAVTSALGVGTTVEFLLPAAPSAALAHAR